MAVRTIGGRNVEVIFSDGTWVPLPNACCFCGSGSGSGGGTGPPLTVACCDHPVPQVLYALLCDVNGAGVTGDWSALNGSIQRLVAGFYDPGTGFARWDWDEQWLGRPFCPLTSGRVFGVPVDTADCATATTALTSLQLQCGTGDSFSLNLGGSRQQAGTPLSVNLRGPNTYNVPDAVACGPFVAQWNAFAPWTTRIYMAEDPAALPAC